VELAGLIEPAAYPGDASAASGVDWVQTHISHVFLTGERVYKLRKAVDLGFVCFATREQRDADCLREVALNRRLAPDVYLGVAALVRSGGRLRVGPVGEALAAEAAEHCVVMRRLPAGRDALSLLERGELAPGDLERVAALVAGFHDRHGLGVPAPFAAAEWLERCTRPVEESFAMIDAGPASAAPPAELARARERCREFVRGHAPRFEARRREGRAVDGHGDLHLQHLWFEQPGAAPIAIDCLEFNADLRRIDAAAEVAFTAMDLVYRGHAPLAERFLGAYAGARDDFDLYGVVDYFASYRAAVRAKVAALAARDPDIGAEQRERAAQSARRHLELAARLLEPRPPGALVLVGGVVGTGKSTAARALAELGGGVVVSSDRVRKRLAGLAPTARPAGGRDEGLYAPQARERVYEALLARAAPLLASGRGAILDATWSRRADREKARALARAHAARCVFLETTCAPEVARARLAQREAAGRDPSDAGPEFLAVSAARFEPWAAGEPGAHVALRTDRPEWREELAKLVGSELAARG
jgi:aminoglycoside phosphotransferase family enzyme/predicted kinase